MSSRPRSRALALVLSVVPGWGHAYWGKEALGLALFTAFAVAASGLSNGLFIYLGDGRAALIWASGVLLAAVLLGAWWDILRRTSHGAVRTAAELRERSLRHGMIAYLRGDLAAATASFEECAAKDPTDVEALFRLGVVTSRAGNAGAARGWLRRALKWDLDDKWRWEIGREIERLKEKSASAAAASQGGRVSPNQPPRSSPNQPPRAPPNQPPRATREAEPRSV